MTNVVDSRKDGEILRRRRKCTKCGVLIHTEEKMVFYGAKIPTRGNKVEKTPTRGNKVEKKRKPMPLHRVEPDFDNMSDDEIETWITGGKEYYQEQFQPFVVY